MLICKDVWFKMKLTNWMQEHRRFLLVGVPFILFLVILLCYLFGGRYISTDNAYIQAAKAAISANVSGQIVKIYVHDNQKVTEGTPLFSLDDQPYQIALEKAKAELINTRLQVQALKATYKQREANTKKAQQTFSYMQQEYNRQKKLAVSGISSQRQLNKATNALENATQQLAVAQQQMANALASLGNNENISVDQHPLVQQAKAQVNRAKLNLSYTVVKAPIDGIVTKVEQIQPGDYIHAGAAVFALISDKNIWVEANLKETQITNIKPGQNAVIVIDAYRDKKISGYVVSTSPGTGATFSLLPPENATGNWVKITQRIPIRIAINDVEKMPFLKSGLSVVVTVDTQRSRIFSANLND